MRNVAEPTHEERFMRDRGALFAAAIGVARLKIQVGDTEGALESLNNACAKAHRLHFDACVEDGHSVEKIELLLGPRDREK